MGHALSSRDLVQSHPPILQVSKLRPTVQKIIIRSSKWIKLPSDSKLRGTRHLPRPPCLFGWKRRGKTGRPFLVQPCFSWGIAFSSHSLDSKHLPQEPFIYFHKVCKLSSPNQNTSSEREIPRWGPPAEPRRRVSCDERTSPSQITLTPKNI